MGALRKLAMIPLAGLALACSRSEQPRQDQAMDPALRSDLESAAAPTSALASSQFKRTQVVSAIELGESPAVSAPERVAAPARRAAPRVSIEQAASIAPVNPAAAEPVPEPVLVAVASAAAPAASAEPAPATTPVAGPRPTPNPVNYPAPEPATRSGIGGVIIRGGSIGDDDHCEIHPRGTIMINQRMPVIRTTFPRGGW